MTELASEPPGAATALKILHGAPTDAELAALIAVLAGRAAAATPAPPPARSPWRDPSRGFRRALPHGPGAWRASGLPG